MDEANEWAEVNMSKEWFHERDKLHETYKLGQPENGHYFLKLYRHRFYELGLKFGSADPDTLLTHKTSKKKVPGT